MYNPVLAIWFLSCVLFVNEHKTAQPSSCKTTTDHLNEETRDEIKYARWGQFAMLAIAVLSYSTFTSETSCISEQTEQFSSCPNGATIEYGYQYLAVETSHTTDVIGSRIRQFSLYDAYSSAKVGYPAGSWRCTQWIVPRIVPRTIAIHW
jgi:hypothetical protein